MTEVEKRSVIDATEEAGARHTYLIEEPIAAAIGAGIDIAEPRGNMVVDIGGGTTDVALISLGGAVLSDSIKIAGDKFDDAIVRYMRKKHNLLIGERTAEEMKIRIGSAYPRREQLFIDVKGRNLISGLPQAIVLGSNEMIDALEEPLQAILESVRTMFEKRRRSLRATLRKTAFALRAAVRCFTALINSFPSTPRCPVTLQKTRFPAWQSARARCWRTSIPSRAAQSTTTAGANTTRNKNRSRKTKAHAGTKHEPFSETHPAMPRWGEGANRPRRQCGKSAETLYKRGAGRASARSRSGRLAPDHAGG